MQIATVVIPNLNGKQYLGPCLDSLTRQSRRDFSVILIDNGSQDGSADFVSANYPEVQIRRFDRNEGFCRAVNDGIRMADTPYVILLNNDTVCEDTFIEELVRAMDHSWNGAGREHAAQNGADRNHVLPNCAGQSCVRQDSASPGRYTSPKIFSCAAKMVQMRDPSRMDNAGDFYCALGWAYALGKGKPASRYDHVREIFSSCAAAAIYRREVFDEIGLFDETHFAYLEDTDVAYRARIAGYRNLYVPSAVVRHVGSATSGSLYNEFKIRYSSRNNVYLIYKNMPWAQIILNLPFLVAGFLIKMIFFAKRGYLREYVLGLGAGAALCRRDKKVRFQWKNLASYIQIQLELWGNLFRRLSDM
ncbi:MAG: glycosyltransferase family 2 protein [Lachnospiraceae bacterium]|nr:glycosyltransferase family 2 protein [Lachnospiraceae bacterium]